MNVNKKQEVTYDISDLTECQARDLLNVCVCHEDQFTESEEETLNNLRQSLLTAGVTKSEGVD